MADIVIVSCADAAVIAAVHHATISVAYRGYFPHSRPPAVAELRTAGLWVIAANDRARRMYDKRGWVLLPGVEKDQDGVTEVRYRRQLPEPGQGSFSLGQLA